MMHIKFTVPGEPRGKGRPRFAGNGRVPYTDSETRAYERKIQAYFLQARGGARFPAGAFFVVEVVAYLGTPKSASAVKQAAMERGEILPSRKPDGDNILKAVLDALNGVAYPDDSRVHMASVAKFYSRDPRVEVTVSIV